MSGICKIFPRLPKVVEGDDHLYLRLAKFLEYAKKNIEKGNVKAKLLYSAFIEADYHLDQEGDNNFGAVFKVGWARKKLGGRYKGNRFVKFIRAKLVDWIWKRRLFVLTDEGIGYTN